MRKKDRPKGKFDWLKHGICCYFPCGKMEAHSNARVEQVQNTYLYLQSVEHLYLYTFHLCVASYLLTSGCVSHLCGQICLLCFFILLSYSFSAAHLVEKSPRELMKAGGKEKERGDPNIKLLKDFLCLIFLYCVVWFKQTEMEFQWHCNPNIVVFTNLLMKRYVKY